jgi:hypothetical protein
LKCGGKLKMPGGNRGKHGGDNLQGREGHRKVGETKGEQGDDNLKCGGRPEMAGENGGNMREII